MDVLLEKLKGLAGEVSPADFKQLMLERPPGEKCPWLYYDGTSYFTAERGATGLVEVRDEGVTPGDIIGVEWKRSDETFLQYVDRKSRRTHEREVESSLDVKSEVVGALSLDQLNVSAKLKQRLTELGFDKKPITAGDLLIAGLSESEIGELTRMTEVMKVASSDQSNSGAEQR